MSEINEYTDKVLEGDCRDIMSDMPEESIHMVMFSPPYWGLRSYESAESVWGGDPECEHEWGNEVEVKERHTSGETNPGKEVWYKEQGASSQGAGNYCRRCGAWRGQFGLEKSFQEYINHLVEVFREIKRILRPDGSVYLNLGDTYAGSGCGSNDCRNNNKRPNRTMLYVDKPHPQTNTEIPAKCKILIPHRVAIALIDDGWIVRNDIVWKKGNPMPSSVKDRLNTTFEYIFHLTKNKRYYYDLDAIREPHKDKSKKRAMRGSSGINKYPDEKHLPNGVHSMTMSQERDYQGYDETEEKVKRGETPLHPRGKNPGDIFEINTKPFSAAHFAVYPPELCKKPIKSSCPPKVCAECGTPYEREYVKKEKILSVKPATGKHKSSKVNSAGNREHYISTQRKYEPDQERIASFLKENNIKDFEQELNKEFGEHTWPHWIRTDDSGACLPDPNQYKKLKEICDLSDRHDKKMLTTVKISVDDKGGKEKFVGWKKQCDCDTDETEPGIVLDPFAGAGTTCMVAKELGRRYIGIEISEEYAELAIERIEKGDKHIRSKVRRERKMKKREEENTSLDKFLGGD